VFPERSLGLTHIFQYREAIILGVILSYAVDPPTLGLTHIVRYREAIILGVILRNIVDTRTFEWQLRHNLGSGIQSHLYGVIVLEFESIYKFSNRKELKTCVFL
jgi:hypothetical protein